VGSFPRLAYTVGSDASSGPDPGSASGVCDMAEFLCGEPELDRGIGDLVNPVDKEDAFSSTRVFTKQRREVG
jgi:hypothetical protein